MNCCKETLDCVGHIGGGAAVAYRTGDGGEFAYAATDAEIVGVDHFAVDLDFLTFEADVGDPVLAAAVGAAGDVDAELLLEAGEAIVEFTGEPAREAFGFGERELAEFGAGASDRGAGESRGATGRPAAVSSPATRTAWWSGIFTITRFCITVLRTWPSP